MTDVLFIDDNIALCEMYRDQLKKVGYNMTIANSGPEALEIPDFRVFDLILLDVMMEPMAGWQVLRRIRERDDGKEVCILMLTGKALLPSEALEYGDLIQGFIMKPLFISKLQEIMERLLADKEEIEKSVAGCGDDVTTRQRSEYMTLRLQIRTWDLLLSRIEKTFEGVKTDNDSEYLAQIQKIKDTLSDKKEQCKELETFLKIN